MQRTISMNALLKCKKKMIPEWFCQESKQMLFFYSSTSTGCWFCKTEIVLFSRGGWINPNIDSIDLMLVLTLNCYYCDQLNALVFFSYVSSVCCYWSSKRRHVCANCFPLMQAHSCPLPPPCSVVFSCPTVIWLRCTKQNHASCSKWEIGTIYRATLQL